MNKKVKVTVCVATYNQEEYISQCLQSLVEQTTNFAYEIIVSDDHSTDNTRAIITQFAEKYPDMVKPIFHNENMGAYKNFVFIHEQATGEYIAHMDGDDYALQGKLQKQADYLDDHPDCNICWHRMYILRGKSNMSEDLIKFDKCPKEGFKRGDILRYITIGMNSSKMYRASAKKFIVPDFPVVDYFANVEQIGDGVANFVSEQILGVYRTGIGISSSGNTTHVILKKSFLYFLNKYPKYKREICVAVLMLFLAAIKNRRWDNALLYFPVVSKTFNFNALVDIWRFRMIISFFRIPKSNRWRKY